MVAHLLVLLNFIQFIIAASVPVGWTSSSYFASGTFVYMPTQMGTVSNQVVLIPYATTIGGANESVSLGIIDFDYQLTDPVFCVQIINSNYSPTGFSIMISYNMGSNILSGIKLTYLTVYPEFTSIFFITSSAFSSDITGPFSFSQQYNISAELGVTLNPSNENEMLVLQHRFNISSLKLCFNVDINLRLINSTIYEVAISTYCNMTINALELQIITFDKTAIEARGCYLKYGQLQSANGDVQSLTIEVNPLFSNNFMMGMKSFHFSGHSTVKFSTTIGTTIAVISNSLYEYLSFIYLSMMSKVCPIGFSFFMQTTSKCYDKCPDGTYGHATSLLCLPCHSTCLTCNSNTNTSCLSCNSTNNLILEVNACISFTKGYQLVKGAGTSFCGDGAKVGIEECDDGNTLDGDGCNGDCTLGNANGCPKISPYKDLVTLNCVASCPNRYFPNTINYTCWACYYTCLTCTNSIDCSSCSSADNRVLNGTACSPQPGFYDENVTIAPSCFSSLPNCLTCTLNGSVCTLCEQGYSLSSTTANTNCVVQEKNQNVDMEKVKQNMNTLKQSMDLIMPFIYAILGLLVLILICLIYRFYLYYKKRRQQQKIVSSSKTSQTLQDINMNTKSTGPEALVDQKIQLPTQQYMNQSQIVKLQMQRRKRKKIAYFQEENIDNEVTQL